MSLGGNSSESGELEALEGGESVGELEELESE